MEFVRGSQANTTPRSPIRSNSQSRTRSTTERFSSASPYFPTSVRSDARTTGRSPIRRTSRLRSRSPTQRSSSPPNNQQSSNDLFPMSDAILCLKQTSVMQDETAAIIQRRRESMRSEVFGLLKPVCVQLTKDHSRANISNLFTALQTVDIVFLQDLQEYVLFPLRVILKHPKKCSQDLYLDLFTCMEYILGHTKVTRWEMFHDIFNTSTSMLSCPTDQSKVARLTEELKIAIIQTIRTLVKNAEHSVLQHLYTIMCLPMLGHAVSLLLSISEAERARNLRILALECLLDLSQSDTTYSSCVKADIGNTYASFLPGISVTLCKIITGDTKQGSTVTTKALYVWMRIVSLVMDDKLLDIARQKQAKQEHKEIDPRLKGLIVIRNNEWITSTGDNLAVLVKQVGTVRSHSNWRVRLGLIECAEHLLLHCTVSMKESVPTFLEILVGMIGDDYSTVADGSRHALELFNQSQAMSQQRQLVEILEENLHKLTTSLPRQIQTAEEDDKLALLNLLAGYLSLLGSKVKSLLLSLPHLKRLSLALCQILELECHDIKIVEERTTITGHGSSVIAGEGGHGIIAPRKHFKHFNNDLIFQKIQAVCRLLGYFGDIHLLVDHFLDIFHESTMFKMQATLIINEIMLGTTGDNVCVAMSKEGVNWHKHSLVELESVIRMLVDEYLCSENFDLQTSATVPQGVSARPLEQQLQGMAVTSSSLDDQTTAAKINRNIVQISLFIEGFGNFSKVLRRDFCPFLMHVLYPLLEKLGDDSAYISSAAFLSLSDISQSCRYKSLDELICDNADYLMNSISLRLRHFQLNKKCPLVLKIMLQYSSSELLPLIDDTIQEILSSLDDYHEEDAVLFMGVLHELTKAVERWFPADKPGNIRESPKTSEKKEGPEEFKQYFINLVRLESEAAGEISQEDLDDFDPSAQVEQELDEGFGDMDQKKEVPKHVLAVKEVMMRSKHILSSKNPRLRLLVLDTISHSCIALQSYQDTLLPLIHEVWPAFSLRFTDEEKLVTIKAIDVLETISRVSGDFVRHRISKDILPKLTRFMKSQGEISIHAGSTYTFTINYKLQLAILKHMGHIAGVVGIQGNDLDLLASSFVPYLKFKQPQPLQTACLNCCKELINIDPDLLWLKLCDLHVPVVYTTPDNRFLEIKKLQEIGPANEYSASVSKLMKETGLL